MGQEIEHKFLVRTDAWRTRGAGIFCQQGYLASATEYSIQARVLGERAI